MRLSIRNGFILALIAAQTLTALAVGAASDRHTKDFVTDAAKLQITQAASTAADETIEYLKPALRITAAAKESLASGTVDGSDDVAVERNLLLLVASHPDVSGIELGRPDGSFVFVRRNAGAYQSKIIAMTGQRTVTVIDRSLGFVETKRAAAPADTYDPRTRPWYQLAEQAGATASKWTAPYIFFSSGTPGITNAQLVLGAEGKVTGVLGVDVELSRLAGFIGSVPVPGGGNAFVTDGSNRAIAVPEASQTNSISGPDGKLRLRTLEEMQIESLVPTASSPPGQTTVIRAGGSDQLVTTQPLSLEGLDWRVAVHASRDRITGAIGRRAHQNRLATYLIGLASLLFAIPLILGLAGPLRRLHKRATIDQLTAVPNRAHLLEQAERLLVKASPVDRPLAVAMFDVDGFKKLNDHFGHDVGDEALQEVARRFSENVRPSDVLGRLGGDEFAIVMPGTDQSAAQALAASITRAIAITPVKTSGGTFTLTSSFGVSSLLPADTAINELLRRADLEMLAAKALRRNTPVALTDRPA